MSSPGENGNADAPRANRRTSSSTLLSAFHRLTQRSQPALDAVQTTNPSAATSQNGTASHHASPILDIGNGIAPAGMSEPNTPAPAYSANGMAIVGPPELKDLISKL